VPYVSVHLGTLPMFVEGPMSTPKPFAGGRLYEYIIRTYLKAMVVFLVFALFSYFTASRWTYFGPVVVGFVLAEVTLFCRRTP
jgi:hypothetical protein